MGFVLTPKLPLTQEERRVWEISLYPSVSFINLLALVDSLLMEATVALGDLRSNSTAFTEYDFT